MPAPTTSDLIFSDQANHNFSKTLGELKRSTLSIHNRLRSIEEDAKFAQRVQDAYNRPLVANERCGSWYIKPEGKRGSAYFKSTDGHTGVWKFSSRRLNLHLLEVIGLKDGCIIVDSTRRGKRMPDALSKTIPIWCSVINRTLFPDQPQYHELYTPPQVISSTEHIQITALLPSFQANLEALNIPLDSIRRQISKPLRPMWITPDSQITPTSQIFEQFHPIICCTVSRRVIGAEVSEGGYIQGAGDDTENWACGLTPPLFWAHRESLLTTSESNLPDFIHELVELAAQNDQGGMVSSPKAIIPTSILFVARLSALDWLPPNPSSLVIRLLPKSTDQSLWRVSSGQLDVGLGPHKLGSRNLRLALPAILNFVQTCIPQLRDSKNPIRDILVACETGKDLAIGVSLAILCLLFSSDGQLSNDTSVANIDKRFIRSRLGWISTSMPDANPSRATLQSVNSFLMERP
ncbi:tRNA a64-2'-o-ribosylphosphate transferase-like protein [Tricladium varicosporioides]|nr:tRNA a64-2'-o-ribosylphosphate transferase-like protein [Hymenoscyphus varicosporioides]